MLTLDTSDSLGYIDDSWAVVAITVRDYNKELITIGTEVFQPSLYSISGTSVQVSISYVHIIIANCKFILLS